MFEPSASTMRPVYAPHTAPPPMPNRSKSPYDPSDMLRSVPASIVEHPSMKPDSVKVSYTLSTTCAAEVRGALFGPVHKLSP